MNDIKYLGVQGLEELIILAQNGLAKKADMLQFDVMPDPIKYIGKVVQYVGVSDVSFTRSHFYYSNGVKWTDEQATQIEIVTALPSWINADPQILYILKDTTDKKMGLYVKNPSVNDSWFTVETSGSFTVVDTLPQWADADSSTIYFKADGNILTGYIKKTGTIGAWYTLGEKPQIDTVISATSENPVQNKVIYAAIQDVLAQVSSIYHYKGSCLAADLPTSDNKVGDTWNLEDTSSYGPQGTNVAWDGTKWDALGGDITLDAVPTDDSQHGVMSGGVYDALLTKEDAANKVTTIDAASTDEQYPSAKAVHDAIEGLEPIPEGFVQNVDTGMQPVEDGKVMRISKTAFDALAQRDPNVMYYLDEEHDLIDAKPTCRDVDGNLVKGQKIVELTKAQYDNLAVKDPDTYYMINDDTTIKDDTAIKDMPVKCGLATYTQNIAPQTTLTISVVFKTPMPNANYAILTGNAIHGTSWWDQVITVGSRTVNGFSIYIYNTNSGTTHIPNTVPGNESGVYWRVEPYKNN